MAVRGGTAIDHTCHRLGALACWTSACVGSSVSGSG